MPNWCNNTLKVRGKGEFLKEFATKAEKKEENKLDNNPLSFKKLLPMPKELEGTEGLSTSLNKELKEKYGADNWYDWAIKNWGVKWDTCYTHLSRRKKKYIFTFDTAWSPPLKALKKISKMFKELYFYLQYNEDGEGFYGRYACKNGIEKLNWTKDIINE